MSSMIRPATPGFLITFAATVILAIVSFSVPLIKSVYFLKASLVAEGLNGDITFGTLGYCTSVGGTTTCSNATVGYQLNINALVGNGTPIQIPQVIVKWLTYALVLHIVAFGLAGISAIFGLLAHFREFSMSCFSSCISGFAATVALAAFIFDIAIFFIAKSRMNAVQGGSASIGNAVWLTLVAWILLFFSGCFYGIGRCCIKRRPRDAWGGKPGTAIGSEGYGEQMRLDAVKAEADRKARQAQGEIGLPAFYEYDPSQPLKERVDGDEDDMPYRDNQSYSTPGNAGMGTYGQSRTAYAGGGYMQAPPGSRAVDEYNNVSSYPPRRQASNITRATESTFPSMYPPSSNVSVPASVPIGTAYDSPPNNPYNHDPYAPQAYGHTSGNTAYNTSPQQSYSPYDPYGAQQHSSSNLDPYNATAAIPASFAAPYALTGSPVYTLGGVTHGAPTAPSPPVNDPYSDPYYGRYQDPSNAPVPMSRSRPTIDTGVVAGPSAVTPTRGPRGPRTSTVMSPPSQFSEAPPTYESGAPGAPGQWGTKG